MNRVTSIVIVIILLILILLAIIILNFNNLKIKETKPPQVGLKDANAAVINIWVSNSSRLDILKASHVRYLIVDIGGTKFNGEFINTYQDIGKFVNLTRNYEKENNYSFILLPYSEVNSHKVDILNSEFQNNFITEYQDLIEMGFDGIHVDIEPVRLDQRNEYLDFLERLNNELPEDAIISVYSGNLGDNTKNEWEWDLKYFKQVSTRCDLIAIPAYDIGLKEKEDYENHLKNQLKKINSISWDSKFLFSIPTHREFPEESDVALNIFEEEIIHYSSHPFIGIAVFAEWTAKESDWEAVQLSTTKLFKKIQL
jgi:hypothetical protein